MEISDFLALIHPILAIIVVFPILGIVTNFAWQTRQRRLQTIGGGPAISRAIPRVRRCGRERDPRARR